MNRLRVFHLIHHLRIGGAERLLTDLLPLLAGEEFEVHVGCLDDRGPLLELLSAQGIPAHFIERRRRIDAAAVWRLARLLRRLRIDILNAHCFSAGLWGRIAALAARIPHVVVTVHSVAGWKQPAKRYVCDGLLRPVTDRFVAVSASVRDSLVARGTAPDAIRVIHNGICLERFTPAAYLVGMVARCSPEKGGDTWIRVLSLLHIERRDVHGVLVGDGPELCAWKTLARRLEMEEAVTFAGARLDTPAWIGVLDLLICPSLQESFGLAALEAQAAGVPVVATRADGFLEVLHDGEDAFLVPPGNIMALFTAARALKSDPALARRLAAAGRRNAATYSIRRTAGRYAALYRELAAG
jgi:glycosyltransferase involved in cell wall biosynthesis